MNDIDLNDDDNEGLKMSAAEKPFQNILLLMRDWANPTTHPFGLKGGEKYLKETLKINEDHKNDARQVRNFIRSAYENINCALMPYPGNKIMTSGDFQGEWKQLDGEFLKHLKGLAAWLFNPVNLAAKKIFNEYVTVEDYAEHMKSYFEAASSNSILTVSSIFDATMESEGNVMVQKSLRVLKQVLQAGENFENEKFSTELDQIGKKGQTASLKKFADLIDNFGGNENFIIKWTEKLKDQIANELKEWKNEVMKNYNKYQSAKKQAQKEVAMKLEEQQKNFQSKLKEMAQKSQDERNKMEAKFNSSLKLFEIEKIKIQQQNEKERQKIVQEKLNDLEKAKKQCEKLISNTKDSYIDEMNGLKKREEQLKLQKQKLEEESKDQERSLKKKLEEESQIYEIQMIKLKQNNEEMKKRIEQTEKRIKSVEARTELKYKIQMEEDRLKQTLKDHQHKTELDRARQSG